VKRYLVAILAIIIFLPLHVSANNFPHIRTHGYDYWGLTKDLDQAKWLAKRHDWIIGAGINETVYDAMKSANQNIRIMPYSTYTTYEKNVQDWIKSWCGKNGYNFEDTLYHYYYDTEVNLISTNNPDKIVVKGFGGGTAKSIQEARVPSVWASYAFGIDKATGQITRLSVNPSSQIWRAGYNAYILNMMAINVSAKKYANGVFLDSFSGPSSPDWNLHLENTIEFRNLGIKGREAARARTRDDLVSALKELQSFLTSKIGRTIVVGLNCADIDYFYHWEKELYANRFKDYADPGITVCIEYMTRAGSNTARIQRLKQAYDSMVGDGLFFFARNETSILNVSEKVNQFLIVSHYLINNPNYNIMYHRGSASFYGGIPAGKLYATHWHKNLEYDIGKPVQRSGIDYWGKANTDRFFVFGSVTTNLDSLKNYTIVGREYTNALVLAKFGGKGGVANVGTNPTTHSLNGTYQLLQPDNSLGPPIREITLGASEGAILIKEHQAVNPTRPPK